MDGEACPACYTAWWKKRHPNNMQLSTVPKINAEYELAGNGITGITLAPIKRVEQQDDGSVTVVIDGWPTQQELPQPDAVPEGHVRVPAQIFVGVDRGDGWLVVLANDGTLWERDAREEAGWKMLPPLPGDCVTAPQSDVVPEGHMRWRILVQRGEDGSIFIDGEQRVRGWFTRYPDHPVIATIIADMPLPSEPPAVRGRVET